MARRKKHKIKLVDPNHFIALVVDAAQKHGERSDDPDHEVGDLQQIVYTLWESLTPEQRRTLEADEDLNDLIVTWNDAISSVEQRTCCGWRRTS